MHVCIRVETHTRARRLIAIWHLVDTVATLLARHLGAAGEEEGVAGIVGAVRIVMGEVEDRGIIRLYLDLDLAVRRARVVGLFRCMRGVRIGGV